MKDREDKKAEIIDFLARTGKKREPSASHHTVNVTGDGNIVGNNNTYIRTEKVEHVVQAEVRPGAEHITDEQAATIQSLVAQIVELEAVTKRRPKSFAAVYKTLNNRFKVPRYRLHKLDNYPAIERYLRSWIGRLSSTASAKRRDPDWRNRKYRYIKVNVRELGLEEELEDLLLERHEVSSIKYLSDDDLEAIYRLVAKWKAT
ncbi:MAG TPA: hypothetical protein DD835_07805 [Halomonas sp.]|nr:hypothetical protein [Halomonas sp.]